MYYLRLAKLNNKIVLQSLFTENFETNIYLEFVIAVLNTEFRKLRVFIFKIDIKRLINARIN